MHMYGCFSMLRTSYAITKCEDTRWGGGDTRIALYMSSYPLNLLCVCYLLKDFLHTLVQMFLSTRQCAELMFLFLGQLKVKVTFERTLVRVWNLAIVLVNGLLEGGICGEWLLGHWFWFICPSLKYKCSNPASHFGFFHLKQYIIQLADGMSVFLLWCPPECQCFYLDTHWNVSVSTLNVVIILHVHFEYFTHIF